MSEQRMCYAGRCSGCNHVVALTLDEPQYRKHTAKEVAEWIADGLLVERMTAHEGHALFDHCTCNAVTALPLFAQEKP